MFRIRIIACCSATVTHNRYFCLAATCLATYSQRKALLGGSQVAASPTPFCRFILPLVAHKFNGSFANCSRIAGDNLTRIPSLHPDLQRTANRKLEMLDVSRTIDDLRVPPGNRLEKLKGDREGQWSIRVNDQYRICFNWTDAGPSEVEFVDYHQERHEDDPFSTFSDYARGNSC